LRKVLMLLVLVVLIGPLWLRRVSPGPRLL